MSKNPKNWWKKLILAEKIFVSSEGLEEFQWNFQGRCDLLQYLKQKKGFTLSLDDTILEKPKEVAFQG